MYLTPPVIIIKIVLESLGICRRQRIFSCQDFGYGLRSFLASFKINERPPTCFRGETLIEIDEQFRQPFVLPDKGDVGSFVPFA